MAGRKTTSVVRRVSRGVSRVRRRSSGGRGRGMFGGIMGAALSGLLGGVAAQVANRFLPSYGTPVGYAAAGYFTNNETLMTLAGVSGSALLPIGSLLGGSTTSTSGAI